MAVFGNLVANKNNNPINQANDISGQAYREGFFNPYGSPRLRAIRRRRAMNRNLANRQSNVAYGSLAGFDPMTQQANLMQSNIRGNSDLSNQLGEEDFAQSQGDLQFQRGLFSGNLDYARSEKQARDARKAAERGMLGQAAGAVGGRILNKVLPI